MKDNIKLYDIAFIGGGLSSTSTLLNIMKNLKDKKLKKLSILMLEKRKVSYGGFVYSETYFGYDSLIITPLNKFIFDEDFMLFSAWLKANKKAWLEKYRENSFEGFKKWYDFNKLQIKNNNFGEIMLPRFIYGDYLKSRFKKDLAKVTNLLEFVYRQTEVIDIIKKDHFKMIRSDNCCFSKKIVLTIGSSNFKSINNRIDCKFTNHQSIFIDNIYNPSLTETLNSLSLLKKKKEQNIMIVGSNATMVDFLYSLYLKNNIKRNICKIFIVSKSGIIPQFLKDFDSNNSKEYFYFQTLKTGRKIRSVDIIKALKKELKEIPKDSRPLFFNSISKEVINIFNSLTMQEQHKFVVQDGINFVKLIRRCGKDHHRAIC